VFRFFDKPFPIGWIDRHLHGGPGIMLDDIVAGLYTLLILQLGFRFYGI
jgi:phosphatidylglycerophosphatase A